MSEALDPAAIAGFLASFRCRATRAIEAHGGIVDKFVGDNVMGVFGVPIATPADAANALAAGRALQAEIAAWNEKRRDAGRRQVSIGTGIHYGQVFVGVIEAGERLEFTVIGDAVNTAHRIEEMTKATNWPLLVSAELLDAAKIPYPSRNCHPLPAQNSPRAERCDPAFCSSLSAWAVKTGSKTDGPPHRIGARQHSRLLAGEAARLKMASQKFGEARTGHNANRMTALGQPANSLPTV